MFTRRRFLRTAGFAAAAPLVGGLYATRIEPRWIEFTRHTLPVRHLPPHLHSAQLLHLSDLHCGYEVEDDYLIDTLRRAAQLNPDFVAYTGDFITGDGEDAFEHLDRVIRHAALGRAGTFAVLGNHDYGHAWRHPDIADRVTARLEAAGIRVLRNAVAPCQGLHFAGFDDLWGRQIEVAHTTAQLPANAPAIALCHNPDAADLPGWDPFDGWILAGHTHGGQIRPPFLPPPHVPVANRRYTAGPFSLSGGRHLFISRGIGHLRHVRFNVRPELARFTLVRA